MITRRSLFGLAAGAVGAAVVTNALPQEPEHIIDAFKGCNGRGGQPDTAGEAALRAYCDEEVSWSELRPAAFARQQLRVTAVRGTLPGFGRVVWFDVAGVRGQWRMVRWADAGHGQEMGWFEPAAEPGIEWAYNPTLNT